MSVLSLLTFHSPYSLCHFRRCTIRMLAAAVELLVKAVRVSIVEPEIDLRRHPHKTLVCPERHPDKIASVLRKSSNLHDVMPKLSNEGARRQEEDEETFLTSSCQKQFFFFFLFSKMVYNALTETLNLTYSHSIS